MVGIAYGSIQKIDQFTLTHSKVFKDTSNRIIKSKIEKLLTESSNIQFSDTLDFFKNGTVERDAILSNLRKGKITITTEVICEHFSKENTRRSIAFDVNDKKKLLQNLGYKFLIEKTGDNKKREQFSQETQISCQCDWQCFVVQEVCT